MVHAKRSIKLNKKISLSSLVEMACRFDATAFVYTPNSSAGVNFDALSLDTRELSVSTVFIATKGAQVDSHDLAVNLHSEQVGMVILDSEWASRNSAKLEILKNNLISFCVLSSALGFMQWWAKEELAKREGLLRLGVTGSSGKTTVKDMLAAVLAPRYSVWSSPGNMNSVLGLPLAILSMPDKVDLAVFEMAMSERGEMKVLADMVRPHHAIITTIGTAHIGNLGSRRGIAEEKIQIANHFTSKNLLLVPEDVAEKDVFESWTKGSLLWFGESVTPVYRCWKHINEGMSVSFAEGDLELPLSGRHILSDVLAVYVLALSLGLVHKQIKEAFASFVPAELRGGLIRGRISIVPDCYNANPDSMLASFTAFCSNYPDKVQFAVLGDMLELGELSESAHEALVRLVISLPSVRCFMLGSAMHTACMKLQKQGLQVPDSAVSIEQAQTWLQTHLRDGDIVFLKASRGMALERLIPFISSIFDNLVKEAVRA